MRPGNRLAGRIKSGRQTIEVVRPIHIVLDVFLAAPDHLHRAIDVLGDLDGQHRAIGLQPSAEATANQMIVNFDRIPWQAGEFDHQRLRERHRLRPDPNVATILLQMNGAVHRLHRRMGQERHLIDGFEPLRRLSKSLSCIAIVTGNRARLFGFLLQLLDDIGVVNLAIRPIVPRDGGSLESLLRRTHVIRHDGNSFIDIDHLPDAIHCQSGLLVHRFRLATEHRRNSNCRNLHTR